MAQIWLRSLRPEVRVIFMSGYSEFPGKNLERMSDGANALQKPFSRSTLLAKVREVLGAAPCKHPNGTGAQGPA
jgi:FixJ family two-component response regulator